MRKVKDFISAMTATGLGLGYMPFAPGTWGTLPAVVIFWVIVWLAPAEWHTWLLAGALAAACTATVWVTPWAEKKWNKKDPGNIVVDEIAGFLVTVLLFRPNGYDIWLLTLWAFLATRFFDIIKLPPGRRLEKLPHGWGVLCDDLWCSLYAAAALWAAFYFWPGAFVRQIISMG